MADRPLVSIVTPSFNQGRFIRETIESVLAQGYPHVEYLVMDGGSTDETVKILQEFDDRLAWVSEPDRGQADAINKGWRRAQGSVLAYLNSDDTYLPDAVERAVACLEEHPEVGAVYGEGYHVNEAGAILERYPTEPFSMERLQETCFICQPTVFLRREIVERVGYLDESLHFCLDYDLWIRIGRVARFVYTPHFLANTRLHGDTKTLGQRARVHTEIMRMIQHHYGGVPPSWVYGYAHALLGPRDRERPWVNAGFIVGLIGIAFVQFLRYNRRVPFSEWARWGTWLRHGWQRLWERPR
jgi:glycosyltransferase involved in cell wall biosynthesis